MGAGAKKLASSSVFRPVPAATLHVSRPTAWLTSRFHFSFAGHYDPSRLSFGPLRVINDDIVTAQNGFGTHPHRDMEILSYIVSGELTHRDSRGHAETLGRGAVQYLSAGTGVAHSETNEHGSDPVRFLQVWIVPDRRGHEPNYGSRAWAMADRMNRIQVIASGRKADLDGVGPAAADDGRGVIPIHQDAAVMATVLEEGVEIARDVPADRQMYVVCVEGDGVQVAEGVTMSMRDGLKIRGPAKLNLKGPGHLFMVDLPRGDDDGWQE